MATSSDQSNPYAPPRAEVKDLPDDDAVAEPAGRAVRLGAVIVDGLILGLVAGAPLGFAVARRGVRAAQLNPIDVLASGPGAIALIGFAIWAGFTIYFVRRNGQSLAKKLFGIKVVRCDGSPASLARIFWLRNVVNAIPSAIPIIGNVYGLIDSLLIFSENRRCLHDRIADTMVIRA